MAADRVFTGRDHARRFGFETHAAWITNACSEINHHGRRQVFGPVFTGRLRSDAAPAAAFIAEQRWSARCPECATLGYPEATEYVDPDEGIFYCFNCANVALGGDGRPVTFPRNREALEAEVLSVDVDPGPPGFEPLTRAMMARPKRFIDGDARRPLKRSWEPGMTLGTLRSYKVRSRPLDAAGGPREPVSKPDKGEKGNS